MTTKLIAIYEKKIRPRAKKTLIGLLVFFAVYTLAGFFALPPLLKYVLTKELSKTLAREVTIAQVRTNPYTLSVAVEDSSSKTGHAPGHSSPAMSYS